MNSQPALFLDRDGVINPDIGYPRDPRDAVLYADVVPSLRRIQDVGILILVVSNQSAIARGLLTKAKLELFNKALIEQLRTGGIQIGQENFYICPHGPDQGCECRKPKPGLFLRAAREHGVDLARSVAVGDRESDVLAARAAGIFSVLLNRNGPSRPSTADLVASSLSDVADFAVARSGLRLESR